LDAPFSIVPVSNARLGSVAVWIAVSSFRHVTFAPAATVIVSGLNLKPAIEIVAASGAFGVDASPPPPHPPMASATASPATVRTSRMAAPP
jgi:hypothetical protein